MTSGNGWAQIDDAASALGAYDQVYLLAVRSPYLQTAHRRELLWDLVGAFEAVGQGDAAESCRERLAELDEGDHQRYTARPVGEVALPAGELPVSSEEVGALEEARRQAAYDVLQAVLDGNEPTTEQVQILASALEAEDVAKMELYRGELQSTSDPARRVAVQWHMIRWLLVKYRVAVRGFGIPIVPEWELRASGIRASLSLSFQELQLALEDVATGMPQATLIEPSRYELRREAALAGRLGQYPDAPFDSLAASLQEASRALISSGLVEPLYVDAQDEEQAVRFFLSPSQEYGRPGED
jgi:hypothetical protein